LRIGTKPMRQLVRDGAAEDEAARLQPDDLVDLEPGIGVQQLVDRHAEAARIGEKRGDIAEHDPLMREIHDGADVILDLGSGPINPAPLV
jgi:hypothetical protein